jgi:rhamnulokinase
MADKKHYIAVDLGAESGRVILATVTDDALELLQAHRFPNGPLQQGDSIRWDFDRIMSEIKTGIKKAFELSTARVCGIGVDSWGVDFGLIDGQGRLLENPYHYRDGRTNGILDKAFALMDKRDIYEHTGIQFLQFNSAFQLLAARLSGSKALARCKKLIFIADLVAYHLCGRAFAEYTLASTSQLMDMTSGQWSHPVFDKLGLDLEIMPDVVQPGTIVTNIEDKIASELGIDRVPVITVGSHDTACAVAGVPASDGNWAYISSGTWSLVGVEVPEAVISDETFENTFTNEGGVEGTIRLLKNVMGLWLVQECRRQWLCEGEEFSYQQLTELARQAEPFTAYIDPDYGEFLSPGDMPAKINGYLEEAGQSRIADKGQMIRVILESLALKYRWVIEKLEGILQQKIELVHVVGGGIQNELLCQFTADSAGRKVIAGPVEATAVGNVIMQARATGQIESLAEGRRIIRNSFELKSYQPGKTDRWDQVFERSVRK